MQVKMRSRKYSPFLAICAASSAIGIIAYVWLGAKTNSDWSTDSINVIPLIYKEENDADIECVNSSAGDLKFPICKYDAKEDIYSMHAVKGGDYIDSGLVTKVFNLLKDHKEVTFIDLGTHLGAYSLPLAHSGINVISVEPTPETVRRLRKSARLGKLQDVITILPYAIANNRSKMAIKIFPENKMSNHLTDDESCKNCSQVEVVPLNALIPFVKTKKVFIKADIENSEIKAFTDEGAGKFFQTYEVLMITMEWRSYWQYANTEVGRMAVEKFVEFFYERNYEVYNPGNEEKLGTNWAQWSFDVVFKKNYLPKDKLFTI